MTQDGELLTVTQAAKALGLSVSTLSRSIKAGKIRSHGGRVYLREVIEDRLRWVDPARRKPAPKPTAAPQEFADGVIALGAALVGQMGPVLAEAAIVCGAPMRVVAALNVEAGAALWLLIDRLASELLGREVEIEVPLSEMVEPDWAALAAAAGEPYDDEAWEAYKFERLDASGSPESQRMRNDGGGR